MCLDETRSRRSGNPSSIPQVVREKRNVCLPPATWGRRKCWKWEKIWKMLCSSLSTSATQQPATLLFCGIASELWATHEAFIVAFGPTRGFPIMNRIEIRANIALPKSLHSPIKKKKSRLSQILRNLKTGSLYVNGLCLVSWEYTKL